MEVNAPETSLEVLPVASTTDEDTTVDILNDAEFVATKKGETTDSDKALVVADPMGLNEDITIAAVVLSFLSSVLCASASLSTFVSAMTNIASFFPMAQAFFLSSLVFRTLYFRSSSDEFNSVPSPSALAC